MCILWSKSLLFDQLQAQLYGMLVTAGRPSKLVFSHEQWNVRLSEFVCYLRIALERNYQETAVTVTTFRRYGLLAWKSLGRTVSASVSLFLPFFVHYQGRKWTVQSPLSFFFPAEKWFLFNWNVCLCIQYRKQTLTSGGIKKCSQPWSKDVFFFPHMYSRERAMYKKYVPRPSCFLCFIFAFKWPILHNELDTRGDEAVASLTPGKYMSHLPEDNLCIQMAPIPRLSANGIQRRQRKRKEALN